MPAVSSQASTTMSRFFSFLLPASVISRAGLYLLRIVMNVRVSTTVDREGNMERRVVYKNFLLLFIVAGICATIAGCAQIQARQLKHSNPTAYVFNVDPTTVRTAIEVSIVRSEFYGMSKATVETTYGIPSIIEVFRNKSNENDVYLFSFEPIGQSKIYHKNDAPLSYYAEFHIHLSPISVEKTNVEVFTYHSSVVTGRNPLIGDRGGNLTTIEVPPSTIEEYEILLRIGEALGVKDSMPPLIVP